MMYVLVLSLNFALAQTRVPAPADLGALVPDHHVTLEGDWNDDGLARLRAALEVAAAARAERPADIREYTIIRHLRLRVGETFSVENELGPPTPNLAGIWGSGISGDEYTTFTFPAGASAAEMAAHLAAHFPEHLKRDQERLDQWRRDVAEAYRPTFCGSLLRAFGWRG